MPTCSTVKSSAASLTTGWHNLRSPALVLVHGGEHSADCWDLTVDEIRCLAPELPVLAIDMPGHGATPGDLTTVTIADCVRSAVDQIEDAGLNEVIVVGHSLAGLTVPGIVAALGNSRVGEMIWRRPACLCRARRSSTPSSARWPGTCDGPSDYASLLDNAEYAERLDLL